MGNTVTNCVSFSYESSALASYLVAHTDAEEKVALYQVEMMAANTDTGLLPLDVRQKDQIINFYYPITSKLSLSQLLKRRTLTRDQFLGILFEIIRIIQQCRTYLLWDKCLLLKEEYIFIDPDSLRISLVYLPIKLEEDITLNYRNLLTQLILFSANIEEDGTDNFIQRLLNLIKSEDFTIQKVFRLITELLRGIAPEMLEREETQAREEACSTGTPKMVESIGPPTVPVKHKVEELKNRSFQIPGASPSMKVNEMQKISVRTEEKQGEKGNSPEREQRQNQFMVGKILLSQVILAFIVSSVFLTGCLQALGEDVLTSSLAFLFLVGAIDGWLLSKLIKKKPLPVEKVVEKEDAKRPSSFIPMLSLMKEKELALQEKERQIYKGSKAKVLLQKEDPIEQICKKPQEVSIPVSSGQTEVLSKMEENYPYLFRVHEGLTEKIVVTKDEFVLGRLHDQVDYVCRNNAIGKVHAEITSKENMYYIKDLNSRNGTFINAARIESNKEYEIRGNDRITLANSEYEFIIPQRSEAVS